MKGYGVITREKSLATEPLAVVMMILPEVVPAGIVAVIFESLTTEIVEGILFRQNFTSRLAALKPLPLISILVPVAAVVTESEVIVGGAVLITVTDVEPLSAIVEPDPAGGAG